PTPRARAAAVRAFALKGRRGEPGILWCVIGFGLVLDRGAMSLRFGECELDSDAREVRRSGRAVPLTPKAYELLALLARNRPRAMSKAEIKDYLWPDTFVSESNLAALVFEVRKA